MTRATPIPKTVTLHVPFRLVKRGGRKEMLLPTGASAQRTRVDSTIMKALARAFRWKRMLDSGEFATVTEIAAHEKLSFTYVSRVLRLSLLAPDIVDAIVAGHQPPEMSLANLLEEIPTEWRRQRARWATAPSAEDRLAEAPTEACQTEGFPRRASHATEMKRGQA